MPDKAKAYGVIYSGPEDFLDEQVLQGIQRNWEAHLANFVTDLPDFEECAAALRTVLAEVFTTTR